MMMMMMRNNKKKRNIKRVLILSNGKHDFTFSTSYSFSYHLLYIPIVRYIKDTCYWFLFVYVCMYLTYIHLKMYVVAFSLFLDRMASKNDENETKKKTSFTYCLFFSLLIHTYNIDVYYLANMHKSNGKEG